MVKKISAIFLALVLCLTALVVPVSALELGDADIAFELKWDKEYYKGGDTATLYVYMDAADTLSLYTGSFAIAFDSDVISLEDNPAGFQSAEMADWFRAYYQEAADKTSYLTADKGKPFTAMYDACSDDEKAIFDWALKFTAGRDGSGSHDNCANSKAGFGGEEFIADEPIITYTFKIADGVEDGTAVTAFIPASSATASPAQTAWKYYKNPGNATTTGNVAATDIDVTQAVATATFGVEPCEEHTWNNGEVKTPATCGAAGEMLFTCTVCNSTKIEAIEATGNHTAGDPVEENIVEPSCNTAGSKDVVVYCSECDAEIRRATTEIPATGEHNFATEVERVEPTCTEDGYYVMACGCGERAEPVTLPAAGHDYEAVVTAPTCTEAGYTTYTCACGDSYEADEVAATGHDMQETAKEVAPTCTEAGTTAVLTCANGCGTTEGGEPVDALGHEMTAGEVVAPTCTEAGYTVYTCANGCGTTENRDETEATGHDHVATVTKQPSCTRTGTMTYECACGDKYTETIPALNHKNADGSSAEVEIPAVEATCSDYGYTAGAMCPLCNTQTIVPTQVPKADHAWDNGVVTEPTYTSQGYTTYTCGNCGETKDADFVPALKAEYSLSIKQPSITKIRCKDTIVLHADVEGADGATVVWTADNANFVMTDLGDGKLEITSAENGFTVFTATLVDADGNELASDTVEMQSKADIWGKIGGFFRMLFGSTLYYNY